MSRFAHDLLLKFGTMSMTSSRSSSHIILSSVAISRVAQSDGRTRYGKANSRSCSIAKPKDIPPLQAADIIAYEMAREERDVPIPHRHPLRRLRELRVKFRWGGAAN